MNYNQGNQGQPLFDDERNLQQQGGGGFVPSSTDRSTDFVSYPQMNTSAAAAHEEQGSAFGAPPMGEPAEPNSHPDNRAAAEQTTGAAPEDPASSSGDGLRGQQSGFDGTPTDRGFVGQWNTADTAAAGGTTSYYQQVPAQPGVAGTAGVGQQPGSPYVQTAEVPPHGKSPMDLIVENLNKWAAKAEGLAGNVWGHLRVGPSVTETAWGRMTHGTRLLTEGGIEGVYRQTFGMAPNEQLRKTYACYLSTSTGPVAGTLYITNLKFAFCSDRPLSYAPVPGQVAWSYYKVVIPLEEVREVVPSVNENKPTEKYIQVLTMDGHEFWFMGFVNYDKGVMNMQDALRNIGVVDPQGGLKSQFGGNRNREVPQQTGSGQGYVSPSQEKPAPNY